MVKRLTKQEAMVAMGYQRQRLSEGSRQVRSRWNFSRTAGRARRRPSDAIRLVAIDWANSQVERAHQERGPA